MKTYDELKKRLDQFFDLSQQLVKTHPLFVVTAMHEVYRTLYPTDPYIPFEPHEDKSEYLDTAVQKAIDFLQASALMGTYEGIGSLETETSESEVKLATGKLYGKIWSRYTFEELTDKAFRIINTRFESNGIHIDGKGKNALDLGCGSGRYSMALTRYGFNSVTGVDYGQHGIDIATETAEKAGIANVSFSQQDALNLPFKDEEFDFSFCSGVLHHTSNMEKGLEELVRVTKKGGQIFLYLYGDGGAFWYARKRMPEIIKQIPQDYTHAVLDMLGMPGDRMIFMDNWYVPLERHSTDEEVRSLLGNLGVTDVQRMLKGRDTDLEYMANTTDDGPTLYGNGELRYFITR